MNARIPSLPFPENSRGVVLVTSLVMLLLISLVVGTSVDMNQSELKVTQNVQTKKRLEANTRQAIEQVISDVANFTAPATQTVTVNGVNITISTPVCYRSDPASGYSALVTFVPEDTRWEVQATATDSVSGANYSFIQGVNMRLLADNCP